MKDWQYQELQGAFAPPAEIAKEEVLRLARQHDYRFDDYAGIHYFVQGVDFFAFALAMFSAGRWEERKYQSELSHLFGEAEQDE